MLSKRFVHAGIKCAQEVVVLVGEYACFLWHTRQKMDVRKRSNLPASRADVEKKNGKKEKRFLQGEGSRNSSCSYTCRPGGYKENFYYQNLNPGWSSRLWPRGWLNGKLRLLLLLLLLVLRPAGDYCLLDRVLSYFSKANQVDSPKRLVENKIP